MKNLLQITIIFLTLQAFNFQVIQPNEKFCYESEQGYHMHYEKTGNTVSGFFEYGGQTSNFTGEYVTGENKLHLIYEDGTQEYWLVTDSGLENPDMGLFVSKTDCP